MTKRDKYLEIMALETTEDMEIAAMDWMCKSDGYIDETTLFQKWGFILGLIVHSAEYLEQFIAQVVNE